MVSGEAWQPAVSSPNKNPGPAAQISPVITTRQRFLFDTGRILRSNFPRADHLISNILAETVAEPDFLQGLIIASSTEQYTRTVIFSTDSYCVLAILWRPGQMSPVHSHRAWCAVGVHSGILTETHFEPVGGNLEHGLRVAGCRQLHPGATSHGPAHDPSAHRMANLGVEPAISIHVYGAPFERLGSDLNQIWAA